MAENVRQIFIFIVKISSLSSKCNSIMIDYIPMCPDNDILSSPEISVSTINYKVSYTFLARQSNLNRSLTTRQDNDFII